MMVRVSSGRRQGGKGKGSVRKAASAERDGLTDSSLIRGRAGKKDVAESGVRAHDPKLTDRRHLLVLPSRGRRWHGGRDINEETDI